MRSLVLASLVFAGAANTGCATLFSGTSQKVRISSDQPDTTVVVLGGTVGSWLAYASRASDVAQKIFDILDPVLGPEAREDLRNIHINELITLVAVHAAEVELPPALVQGREYLARLPKPVIDQLLGLFSIMDLGTAPREPTLKRGTAYTVVAWAPGCTADVEIIDVRFNWVTLWNILHGGLGFGIDLLTGAWLKLEDRIEFRLPADR